MAESSVPVAKDPKCSVVTMPVDYLSDLGLSVAERLDKSEVRQICPAESVRD
jgi:hypothetical protein